MIQIGNKKELCHFLKLIPKHTFFLEGGLGQNLTSIYTKCTGRGDFLGKRL